MPYLNSIENLTYIKQLIGKCLENDSSAQEELYHLYADKMFTVCMYYAVDRDEAADFLQDGYIKVFRKLHTYKFNGSFEGWLRRIIVNTALSHIRMKKKFTWTESSVDDIPDVVEVEEKDLQLIPKGLVIQKVNELPEKAGIVLKLFAIEGYSHQEIAQIMEITVGTSKSQLNRARAILKKSLSIE